MAESLLGGILRDDEEALAVKATEALAGPKAFAAAIADHSSSQNPEVARQLAAPVGKQAHLPETHAEHLQYHHRLGPEYPCEMLREALLGLPTHAFLMRRQPLKFSSTVVNDQRRVCSDNT